uniref:DUF5745 domain-containing protein n=1 Tax=Tetraselmis sp. GSL018 TaxID=582737 RepID=A0A061RXQ2_9CHLO
MSESADDKDRYSQAKENGVADVLNMCNRMLDAAGLVAHVETEEDMRIICAQTSVFVAACEAVTGQPLKGINRHPSTVEDRAENMSVVIQRIAALLNTDLNHLSGARIACGDLKDIFNLVEILVAKWFRRCENNGK